MQTRDETPSTLFNALITGSVSLRSNHWGHVLPLPHVTIHPQLSEIDGTQIEEFFPVCQRL